MCEIGTAQVIVRAEPVLVRARRQDLHADAPAFAVRADEEPRGPIPTPAPTPVRLAPTGAT